MRKQDCIVSIAKSFVEASAPYDLSKIDCNDAAILDQSVLTSGPTWHAAAGIYTTNGDPNVAKLQQDTIEWYKKVEKLAGKNIELHITGCIRLAVTKRLFDPLQYAQGKVKSTA